MKREVDRPGSQLTGIDRPKLEAGVYVPLYRVYGLKFKRIHLTQVVLKVLTVTWSIYKIELSRLEQIETV